MQRLETFKLNLLNWIWWLLTWFDLQNTHSVCRHHYRISLLELVKKHSTGLVWNWLNHFALIIARLYLTVSLYIPLLTVIQQQWATNDEFNSYGSRNFNWICEFVIDPSSLERVWSLHHFIQKHSISGCLICYSLAIELEVVCLALLGCSWCGVRNGLVRAQRRQQPHSR